MSSLRLFLAINHRYVSVKHIAAHAGVSKKIILKYFSSKEEVFLETLKFFFSDYIYIKDTNVSGRALSQFYRVILKGIEGNKKAAEDIGRKQVA
jgi:AcrR family transcriptional regulator